jgi:hypothetical protein
LPLSERQHQERAESAARQRAEFDATRNMIMFASAAIMGLITFFIARAFF